MGEGSEVKILQPWITNEDGYTSSVRGTLKDVIVTSDLSYPHLASAEALQVCSAVRYHRPGAIACSAILQLNVALHFPRVWNATQHWDMQLMASQVEISVLFSYIDFINGESLVIII